jgi:hypothetical protein
MDAPSADGSGVNHADLVAAGIGVASMVLLRVLYPAVPSQPEHKAGIVDRVIIAFAKRRDS